jgi:hypothetical protein
LDYERFDDLTRTLATTTTRRQALKLLGGSLAGGLLAFLGVGEAGANGDTDCKQNGKTCKKDRQCCSGSCVNGVCSSCILNTPPFTPPTATCSSDNQCCGTGSCCQFDEELPPGCFDLLNNFSACGTSCENAPNCLNIQGATACVNGVCMCGDSPCLG